jgi:hypothetical protein
VKITFDQTLIPALRQFNKIRFRVVGKISNAADLVNGVLDYSVNSPSGPFGADAINFADLTSGYVVYDSGFVDLFTELYGNEFTTPLCIWFDVAPVSTEVGSQQRFYITASDLMLAKD